MITMITAIIILAVIGLTSSHEEMTHEEKRIENALFAMVGEEPPHQDVPMDHNDQAIHDLLLTSAREKSVGHDGSGAADVGKNKEHSVGNDARLCQNDDPTNKSPGGVMAEMWFQSGFEKVVLSKFWNINDLSGLAITCFIVFILGVVHEGIKCFRTYLLFVRKAKRKESFHLPTVVTVTDGRALKEDFTVSSPLVHNPVITTTRPGPFSFVGIIVALFHTVQLFLWYCLILIVTSYNIWLAFSVILGSAFGTWLFSAFCKIKSSEEADLITSNTCQH